MKGENKLVPGGSGRRWSLPVTIRWICRWAISSGTSRIQRIAVVEDAGRKERAVVFHRSRAWTDAGSRGYELLIEDGRLKWSLIHFWPGNAISIAAEKPLPLNRVDARRRRHPTAAAAPRGCNSTSTATPPRSRSFKDHLTKRSLAAAATTSRWASDFATADSRAE